MLRIVRGTPIWLFKFPLVAIVLNFCSKTILINSAWYVIQKSNDFNTPVIAKAIKDNGTNGLLLPLKKDFIFRFGKNSFDMTQVAPDVFNVSMRIEEEF